MKTLLACNLISLNVLFSVGVIFFRFGANSRVLAQRSGLRHLDHLLRPTTARTSTHSIARWRSKQVLCGSGTRMPEITISFLWRCNSRISDSGNRRFKISVLLVYGRSLNTRQSQYYSHVKIGLRIYGFIKAAASLPAMLICFYCLGRSELIIGKLGHWYQ